MEAANRTGNLAMNFFPWRLEGQRTLAYLLDDVETPRFILGQTALQEEEALCFWAKGGKNLVFAPSFNLPENWRGQAAAFYLHEEEQATALLSTASFERMFCLALKVFGEKTLYVAVKFMFEPDLSQADLFCRLAGGKKTVADDDVCAPLAEKLEELLAPLVADLRPVDVSEAALKGRILESVREFGSEYGLKTLGVGLTIARDEARAGKMAALRARQAEDAEDFKKVRHKAQCARTLSSDLEKIALIDFLSDQGQPRRFEEKDLFLKAAFGVIPESYAGIEILSELSGSHGSRVSAERQRLARECEEAKDFCGEVAPVFETHIWAKYLSGPKQEVAEPVVEEAENIPTGGQAHSGWRIYGENTLASLVDPSMVPSFFRKDFSLDRDEELLVISQRQCEEVITRGTERTSPGLLWINKLFTAGQPIKIVFVTTRAFGVVVDLEGSDSWGDEVQGELCLNLKFSPLTSALGGAAHLFDKSETFSLQDLAERLKAAMLPVLHRELLTLHPQKDGFGSLEHALVRHAKKECAALGLNVEGQYFHWVRNRESAAEINHSLSERHEADWRFAAARRVKDAAWDLEKAARRIENIAALSRLEGSGSSELRALISRAVLGEDASDPAKANPAMLSALLSRAGAALTEAKAALRTAGEEEAALLALGPPQLKTRSFEADEQAEEENFLTGGLVDDGWDEESAFNFMGTGAIGINAGQQGGRAKAHPQEPKGPLAPSALNGLAHGHQVEPEPEVHLSIGGVGVKQVRSTRCVHCMAPIRPEASTCGNCGRRL